MLNRQSRGGWERQVEEGVNAPNQGSFCAILGYRSDLGPATWCDIVQIFLRKLAACIFTEFSTVEFIYEVPVGDMCRAVLVLPNGGHEAVVCIKPYCANDRLVGLPFGGKITKSTSSFTKD